MIAVLCVDDEPSVADTLRLYLERDPDLTVSIALSAEEALAMVQPGRYDVIISDYEMPGMNGIQLLQKVREISPQVPFIIFTGKGREEVAIESINSGVDYYVKKGGDPKVQFAELAYFVKRSIELRESREKYQRIFDNAIEGIYQISPKGRFMAANPVMAQILGYDSVGDLIGTCTDTTRQLWVDQAARNTYVRYLREHGFIRGFECEFFRKDGSRIWVSLNTRIIRGPGGAVVSSEGFLEDITARKQAEQALRESEEMFRNPVEQSPVGVFLIQDDLLRYANPMLAGMLGYAREELIGRSFEAVVSLDDLPRVREAADMLLDGKPVLQSIEFRGVRKDGSPVMLEVYGSSMAYQGAPALCGSVIDITTRRELEEKVARSLREKELLIKEIHHRVKNNLQVISSLLFLQARAIPDERVRDLLRESQNRVKAIALVHEKLYQSDTLDEIDYADYVRKIVPYLFETFQVDESRIRLQVQVGRIFLPIDRAVPCSLIINEMISNSLKHAFPGGRAGTISIELARTGELLTLVYHDDGVGMPPGITFEHTTTLGMQLIAGYVNQLNGTITLLREEGTTYTVTFPA